MIQPKGTVTYKGNRKSLPGTESYEKDEKILNKAGDFHAEGKAAEKKAADKAKAEKKPAEKVAEPAKLEEGKK